MALKTITELFGFVCNNMNEEQMSFWEHLDVLRGTIWKIALASVVCGVVAFFFKDELFSIILAPKDDHFITYRLFERLGSWIPATKASKTFPFIW